MDSPTVQDILGSPLHFPDPFKKWLLDYFATNVPQIPFKQVAGAQDYLFKAANSSTTTFSTTSATAQDVGANTVSNLKPGQNYAAILGTLLGGSAAVVSVSGASGHISAGSQGASTSGLVTFRPPPPDQYVGNVAIKVVASADAGTTTTQNTWTIVVPTGGHIAG